MDKAKEVWLCDPRKNKDCRKTSCYLNDGPCRCTTRKEYALSAFGEAFKAPVNEVMNKNGPV